MEAIEVENLHKSYEKVVEYFLGIVPKKRERVEALKGVSFSVKRGEVLGYLGPNGSGKSTTLKILSGILHPDSGEVGVLGHVPWERKREFLESIGAMFGHRFTLFWDVPVEDTFLFLKELYKVDEKEYRDRLDWLNGYLGVKEYLNKPARELSLGERIRCELASVLLHDPEVVLLDEPMIGVDVWTKERIRELILELKRRGKTVVISSHQMEDIEPVVERVILLKEGTIVFDGSVEELKKRIGWKRVVVEVKGDLGTEYVVRREGNVVELRIPADNVEEVVRELLEMGATNLVVEEPKPEEIVRVLT